MLEDGEFCLHVTPVRTGEVHLASRIRGRGRERRSRGGKVVEKVRSGLKMRRRMGLLRLALGFDLG
jgi:hypothetical protein